MLNRNRIVSLESDRAAVVSCVRFVVHESIRLAGDGERNKEQTIRDKFNEDAQENSVETCTLLLRRLLFGGHRHLCNRDKSSTLRNDKL